MKALLWLIVFLIPLILLLSNLKVMVFEQDFHQTLFSKYNVYADIPEADEIDRQLVDYFADRRESIAVDRFNEREIDHLRDVREVLHWLFLTLNILVIVFLLLVIIIYFVDKKGFMQNVSWLLISGGSITIGLLVLLWFFSIFNFDALFSAMHATFFRQGTWIFDANDALVRIYQEGFFQDMLIRIAVNTVLWAAVILLIGLAMKKYIKSQNKDTA
ncbi:MAG TPA: DUF1461 domain-containing protein [Candidatus Nanoarchaeia archaeon]|nr:DUF1461 domain-containing protein [Candidatus Nanoarchaeia archaeon]